VPTVVLELLFAAMMLQSAYSRSTKRGDYILTKGDPLRERSNSQARFLTKAANRSTMKSVKVRWAAHSSGRGPHSGLLWIGSGALR